MQTEPISKITNEKNWTRPKSQEVPWPSPSGTFHIGINKKICIYISLAKFTIELLSKNLISI